MHDHLMRHLPEVKRRPEDNAVRRCGPAATVLVVEPDHSERTAATHALENSGFRVVTASDAMAAFAALEEAPDLVVLELLLPVISGLEVLSVAVAQRVPAVIHTAVVTEGNTVRALQLGADDVIRKPCPPRELGARVSTILRRAGRASAVSDTLLFDGLRIDRAGREVWMLDELIPTTAKEFDLLVFLCASPGVVFTRERLLREVWNSSAAYQQPATVTEHIRRLRQKIEADQHRPRWLMTVRGVGYKFERRGRPGELAVRDADRREAMSLEAATSFPGFDGGSDAWSRRSC